MCDLKLTTARDIFMCLLKNKSVPKSKNLHNNRSEGDVDVSEDNNRFTLDLVLNLCPIVFDILATCSIERECRI